MEAFAVVCQVLAIRPTAPLFLHFYRCCPVAKRGWVSLISEPGNALLELYSQSIIESGRAFFFYEDRIPKFPLYWTQNPLKFTSWPEDKMTIGELEALSVLTALPRPFSSRRVINCLEHVDYNSRVFEIMGRKGPVHNWFKAIDSGKMVTGRPGPSARAAQSVQPSLPPPNVRSSSPDEVAIVEEQPLIRKRRGKANGRTCAPSKKMKEVEEEMSRPLPGGVWDPSFNLSHKIDFNLDDSEKKVVESMTEQQMTDAMLELASRTTMVAWHMAYAFDKGVVRVKLEKVRTQLKELTDVHSNCEQRQRQSEQFLCEAQELLNNVRSVGLTLKKERDELQIERDQMASELEQSKKTVAALTKERDALLVAAAEEKEIRKEMGEAIVVEHTRGFKKALRQVAHLLQVSTEGVAFDLRKDVYESQMLPLDEIPDDAFLDAEGGDDAGVDAAEEPNAEATGGSVVGSPNVVID
ncbi:hypothetical protein LR48_Vigan62s001800 [Vigna angularis]|uniref:Uncharacterized protein n=1 Tax=Phaseolus angularis TaxID=3914 RepID=A0A0L9T4D8_PHAAN|nr:hypothetical protein LR48_Vigan62s001800 [Vigna angularis]